MKLRTLCILGLALAVCTDAPARARKKKQAKKPVTEEIQPVPADSFSYAIGVAQGNGLKQYLESREGVTAPYLKYAAEGIKAFAGMTPEEVKQKLAFAAGLRIGEMNRKQVIPSINQQATGKTDTAYVDEQIFNRGLAEVITEVAALSPDSAMKVAERQMKYFTNQLKKTNLAWLESNREKKGVKTTESGLQYRILSKGEGPVASDTDEVEVHYEGTLIDGKIFDSSYKRNEPATFRCNQVIKGWTEALKIMPEGSVWELYIPYDLAYGESGSQNIPPFSTLIFKVELLKVKKAAEKQ